MWDFQVLGPLRVLRDGEPISIRGQAVRRVLAVLLAHRGVVVPRGRLLEALWSEEQPLDPTGALYTVVSRLRRALAISGRDPLHTQPSGYILEVSENNFDVARFETLITAAHSLTTAQPERALQKFCQAQSMWRGAAYQDTSDILVLQPEIARLEELRLTSIEDRAQLLVSLGKSDEATPLLEAHLAAHALRERPLALLARIHYARGRQTHALDLLARHRKYLSDELGLDPTPRLQQIEREILRHEVPEPQTTSQEHAVPDNRSLHPGERSAALRLPASSFIGRNSELRAISDVLSQSRLVTLVGTGGVGKTRLAQHVAHSMESQYPNGVAVCQLAGLTDANGLLHCLASIVDVLPESAQNFQERVLETLAGRRMLLLLDNCEHLLTEVAEIADYLVHGASSIHVLATSREPLGIAGEQVRFVEPLTVPDGSDIQSDAVTLFADRAFSVNPRFSPENEDWALIAELCRRLDGLPLAIELAAARTRTISVREIVYRLDDQLDILQSRVNPTSRRHSSLRSVIDWSYSLLDNVERDVFAQLSYFPGEFSLDDAVGVLATDLPPGELIGVILRLAERSLLRYQETLHGSRYGMLETLRHFGMEQLAAAPIASRESVAQRHAAWYVFQAERIWQNRAEKAEESWITLLDREMPHLRAAHRWLVQQEDVDGLLRLSASLHTFGAITMRAEVHAWAHDTVRISNGCSHPLLAISLGSIALSAWMEGQVEKARNHALAALKVADHHGEAEARFAHHVLGNIAISERRYNDARKHFELLRDLSNQAEDGLHAPFAATCIVGILVELGELDEAAVVAESILAMARHHTSLEVAAMYLMALGRVAAHRNPAEALNHFWRAAELAKSSMYTGLTCHAWLAAATMERRSGDLEKSARTYLSMLTTWSGLAQAETPFSVTMREIIELLASIGDFQAASVLCGALPHTPTRSAFSNIPSRFPVIMSGIRTQVGSAAFASSVAQGRRMSRTEAIRFAATSLSLISGNKKLK